LLLLLKRRASESGLPCFPSAGWRLRGGDGAAVGAAAVREKG